MTKPKTALDLADKIENVKAGDRAEADAAFVHLRDIPADAPEQIAELETRREETIAMCAQLDAEKAELEARLAAAMGALQSLRDKCAREGWVEGIFAMRDANKALADEPPASKRYRAIKEAAEAWETCCAKHRRIKETERVPWPLTQEYLCLLANIGKAVRGEGE